MRVAVYPGTFSPWHKGHEEVLEKALAIFDKVIIAQGVNPDKEGNVKSKLPQGLESRFGDKIKVTVFSGLLADFLKEIEVSGIVRGLRNSADFEQEKVQQYWNEDLGVKIPTFYFISSRDKVHISSTAVKNVNSFKVK